MTKQYAVNSGLQLASLAWSQIEVPNLSPAPKFIPVSQDKDTPLNFRSQTKVVYHGSVDSTEICISFVLTQSGPTGGGSPKTDTIDLHVWRQGAFSCMLND